jgi:murein DD-endopeptidase MepM/ murein hydrolase activator NlpD
MKLKWLALPVAALIVSGSIAILAWQIVPDDAPETAPVEVAAVASPVEAAPPPLTTRVLEIGRRDSLIAALLRHEVPSTTAHAIATALREAGANLRRIRPGDRLQLATDEAGQVVKVNYTVDAWQHFDVADGDDGWHATRTLIEPELRAEVRHGEVQRSLWDAVTSGAITAPALLDLVQIFESEFDFAADAQPGDRFRVLVEARYANGVLVDYGRILAAQYVSDDKTLTGVAFEDKGRFTYFDPEGRSLKKMFLRSPLEFTRISSGFTHRRPHPVLGGVRPHLAIDYAAPTGTPVWSVADGVVLFAGRKGGNGIQVRVQHRGGYETYYNHLSRVAPGISRGVRVAQKQLIGRVGSTGLSTGPHLDYRVSHKGKFVNPLNEKFFPGEPIATAKRADFVKHAGALIERLEREAPFEL